MSAAFVPHADAGPQDEQAREMELADDPLTEEARPAALPDRAVQVGQIRKGEIVSVRIPMSFEQWSRQRQESWCRPPQNSRHTRKDITKDFPNLAARSRS